MKMALAFVVTILSAAGVVAVTETCSKSAVKDGWPEPKSATTDARAVRLRRWSRVRSSVRSVSSGEGQGRGDLLDFRRPCGHPRSRGHHHQPRPVDSLLTSETNVSNPARQVFDSSNGSKSCLAVASRIASLT